MYTNAFPSISFKNINIDKRKRVDLKLSTMYIFTHTANSFKKASPMTRADYGICLFFLVAKQSLSENLISTERDLTQRRTIQSQS